MQESDDRSELSFEFPPAYPTTVRMAGIAWIVSGALILLNLVVLLLLMVRVGVGGPERDAVPAIAGGALLMGLFGAAFIFVGVQSVRGTARDALGNGIGSIGVGLFNFACGFAWAALGASLDFQVLQASISVFVGLGLLGAGILALVGRSDYKTWRIAQKTLREERLNR